MYHKTYKNLNNIGATLIYVETVLVTCMFYFVSLPNYNNDNTFIHEGCVIHCEVVMWSPVSPHLIITCSCMYRLVSQVRPIARLVLDHFCVICVHRTYIGMMHTGTAAILLHNVARLFPS